MNISPVICRFCMADLRDGENTKRIDLYDRELDCVVGYECPKCGAKEPRQLAEILAVADPAAFKEVP